jgi:hypothetical protein
LPANELRVVLAATQVLAARTGWSWNRGKPMRCVRAPVELCVEPGEPGNLAWQRALAALEPLLGEQAPGTRVHVTLSNSLVRYALVPSQPQLARAAQDAYVRDCFGQLYGEAAASWDICTAAAPGTARVASAIDAGLAGELAAACARAGTTLASLRPLLSTVVARWRGALRGRCFWLVLAEPGMLCLALAERRHWRVLRTVRAGGDWLDGLAVLLEREILLAGVQADVEKLFLWAPELAGDAPADVGHWPVTRLSAAAHGAASSGTAARFGVGR